MIFQIARIKIKVTKEIREALKMSLGISGQYTGPGVPVGCGTCSLKVATEPGWLEMVGLPAM